MMKKTIVITGGNSGLGLETAKYLARDKNNIIILGCRNQKTARSSVEQLKGIAGNKDIPAGRDLRSRPLSWGFSIPLTKNLHTSFITQKPTPILHR